MMCKSDEDTELELRTVQHHKKNNKKVVIIVVLILVLFFLIGAYIYNYHQNNS